MLRFFETHICICCPQIHILLQIREPYVKSTYICKTHQYCKGRNWEGYVAFVIERPVVTLRFIGKGKSARADSFAEQFFLLGWRREPQGWLCPVWKPVAVVKALTIVCRAAWLVRCYFLNQEVSMFDADISVFLHRVSENPCCEKKTAESLSNPELFVTIKLGIRGPLNTDKPRNFVDFADYPLEVCHCTQRCV